MVESCEVFVVGAGICAIGAVIRLERDLGITDVVACERADDIGGTWHFNSYPGCACDVPSVIYSFEFAPNPEWDRVFAERGQIHRYVKDVAERHGVPDKVRLGTEVTAATWNAADRCWDIETTAGSFRAPVLIFAPGALHEASLPDVPGRDGFAGTQFHSSRWDHEHDLTGRRVAVVGTGASGVQVIPQVVRRAAHTTVVQRTPLWVWPKPDWRITRVEKWLYRRWPRLLEAQRRVVWRAMDGLLRVYQHVAAARLLNAIGRLYLHATVRDPGLRRALTPDWVLGCKRVTFSNAYYQSLTDASCTVAPHGVREVTPEGIVTTDGVEHQVDTIVWCTGFHVADPPFADRLVGRHGRTLAEAWAGNPRAYLGASVDGFPNAFMLFGPNAGTASCMPQLEAQMNYVVNAIDAIRREPSGALDIRREVVDDFKAEMNRKLAGSTWQLGGCTSFYHDATGENYLIYGGTMTDLLDRSKRFDRDMFEPVTDTAAAAV